jgi:hypothetical protein
VKLKFHWKQHFSMLARIPCLTWRSSRLD